MNNVKTYRKTALTQAIKWRGDNIISIINFAGQDRVKIKNNKLHIYSLEGWLPAKLGDMVMMDVNNNFYVCDLEVFNNSYELVEENKNGN